MKDAVLLCKYCSTSILRLAWLQWTTTANMNIQINHSGILSHPVLDVLWNIFNAFNCPWKKVITVLGVLTNLCTMCLYLYMYCGTNTQQLGFTIATLTSVVWCSTYKYLWANPDLPTGNSLDFKWLSFQVFYFIRDIRITWRNQSYV